MSQINLERILGLVPMETALPDPTRGRSKAAQSESFNDHLWRVREHSGEKAAGGHDSARLSPPQSAAAATGQSTAEREPAADDHSGQPQDSVAADSDENAAGQVSADQTEENDQAGATPPETDAQEAESSETAEADSQLGKEQETDGDSDSDAVNVVNAEGAPENVLPEQPAGQPDKGNADQSASGTASAEQTANSAAQTATQEAPALQQASGEDPAGGASVAEADAEVSGKTLVPKTDVTGDQDRSEKRRDAADKVPAQQQPPHLQDSRAGAPLHEPGQGEAESTADRQAGARAKEHPSGKPAGAVAESPQTDAPKPSTPSAISLAQQTGLVGEQKVNVSQETTKPAATAAPESRLSASLRTAPGQEPRTGSTPQPNQASESDQADQARFVERVARAFRAVGGHSGSVRLRLSPPELGSLRLEITVRNGLMTARVEAETPTARNLLLDNLPALRDRLAQQDIKIKQFDVGLMDRSPGGLPDQTADHTQSRHQGGGHGAPQAGRESDPEVKTVSDPGAARRPGEGTQLNVII